jgi:hypothetical protein
MQAASRYRSLLPWRRSLGFTSPESGRRLTLRCSLPPYRYSYETPRVMTIIGWKMCHNGKFEASVTEQTRPIA